MTAVVFKRDTTAPVTLAKGEISLADTGSNTAAMYVGNNTNVPVRVIGAPAQLQVSSVGAQSIPTTFPATKTFTFGAQPNLQWSIGTRVRAANDATHYMEGTISSYTNTSIVVTVDRAVGTGALSGWSIGIVGDVGATGATGAGVPSGGTIGNLLVNSAPGVGTWATDNKVTGAASSTDNAIARFDGVTGKLVKNSSVAISDAGLITGLNSIASNKIAVNGTYHLNNNWTSGAVFGADGQNKFLLGYSPAFFGGSAVICGATSNLTDFAPVAITGTSVTIGYYDTLKGIVVDGIGGVKVKIEAPLIVKNQLIDGTGNSGTTGQVLTGGTAATYQTLKTVNGNSLLGVGNIGTYPTGGTNGQSLTLVSGVPQWQSCLMSVLSSSVPLRNGEVNENTIAYSMTMGAINTLGCGVSSGRVTIPTTGIYDLYAEGRPDINNVSGGIYGVVKYDLYNVTTSTVVVHGETNFPVNGNIGLLVKLAGLGISLNAADQLAFRVGHWSGSLAGTLSAHTAQIKVLLRR